MCLFYRRYSAKQVLGVPNVFKYGDDEKAWAQASGRGLSEEYLQVRLNLVIYI